MAVFACALAASAAGMDGHWSGQFSPRKKAAAQTPTPFSLDLKTSGAVVTGTVGLNGGKKPRFQKIEDGKLVGGHATFTTRAKGKSPASFSWDVTLEGDKLSGMRTRDGAKHGQAYTAERN